MATTRLIPYPQPKAPKDTATNIVHEELDEWKKRRETYSKLDWLGFFLPIVNVVRFYNWRTDFLWDLLAGATVGVMVVPQGLSYANLAGLPSIYGLYGAFVPNIIYALFGSSRQLAVGPVAVTSLLLSAGLSSIVHNTNTNFNSPKNPALQAEYNLAAIQVAFVAGFLYTTVGIFRLGVITNFLSHAVISGFSTGAATIIVLSQVQYILGCKIPRADRIHDALHNIFVNIKYTNWHDFVMGFTWIIFIVVCRYIGDKYKKLVLVKAFAPFVVCVLGTVLVVGFRLDLAPAKLRIVGTMKAGLPHYTANTWTPLLFPAKQVSLAFLICVVDLCESLSIAKTLARKNHYDLKPTQELCALGFANIAGAMFSSYTTTGSFSRSAVSNAVGARSPLAALFAGIIVMFALLFLAPALYYMPQNVQGAVVITAVFSLFNFKEAYHFFRISKLDFLVWTVAFLITIFVSVEYGIGTSIGLSLAIVIFRAAFPSIVQLGRLKGTSYYRNISHYNDVESDSTIVIIRVNAPIFFANAPTIRQYILNDIAKKAEKNVFVRAVVVDLSAVNSIDASAELAFRGLVSELQDKKISLHFANPTVDVAMFLAGSGFVEFVGASNIHVGTHDAVEAAKAPRSNDDTHIPISSEEVELVNTVQHDDHNAEKQEEKREGDKDGERHEYSKRDSSERRSSDDKDARAPEATAL